LPIPDLGDAKAPDPNPEYKDLGQSDFDLFDLTDQDYRFSDGSGVNCT
jgi:hypothetical protein